jgi:GT2 family glycosyltransferase
VAAGPLVQVGRLVPGSPRVSICVLVLRDVAMLQRCLDSLSDASDPSLAAEVIVVGNGTPLSALEQIGRREDVVLVRSGTNLGFGGGNNLAAEVSQKSDYLVFLNDDTLVAPGWLRRLTATADTSPNIGAVGSRIVSPAGVLREAGSVVWDDGSTSAVGQNLPADTPAFRYVREVDFCSANGLMVRRSAWDAVGGFDENYFPAYQEDADLCMSVRAHGYRVVYEPRSILTHLESQSSGLRFREFLYERHRRYFAQKWKAQLAGHEPPPESTPDFGDIDRAVHRARGRPPRALVALGDRHGAGCGLTRAMEVVEALSGWGWAVAVARRYRGGSWNDLVQDPSVLDHLVDLGVDLRPGAAATVVSRVDPPFELIVSIGPLGFEDLVPPARLRRPDCLVVLDAREPEPAPSSPDPRSVALADHVLAADAADRTWASVLQAVGVKPVS